MDITYLNSSLIIIILCSVVILSYFFSLVSLKTRIPSVLLLLISGIIIKQVVGEMGIHFEFPATVIELLGTVGLIMIILEAGLDLKLGKGSKVIVRKSVLSAFMIMLVSVFAVAFIIKWWLGEPLLNSVVYALPLSVISGAIVIPSLGHLSSDKRDFLVYEASFSDIIGILFFNYIVAEHALSVFNISMFLVNLLLALVASLVVTIFLFYLITRSKVNVKFFLSFAILVLLYVTGKLVNLPSLIIILAFGLMVSNWGLIKFERLTHLFPHDQIEGVREMLHSITAESSFLIRTFFFVLFGYSIDITLLLNGEVILAGSAIVLVMLGARYLYLRTFLKSNIYPELYYMPRGLITILLFYKIPAGLQLSSFNEGILFFVILATGLIMMFGAMFYKQEQGIHAPDELYEQG